MQHVALCSALQPAHRPAAHHAIRPPVVRAATAAAGRSSPPSSSSSPSGGELEPWQVSKLQQALLAGRRQVKVRRWAQQSCQVGGAPPGIPLLSLLRWPSPSG